VQGAVFLRDNLFIRFYIYTVACAVNELLQFNLLAQNHETKHEEHVVKAED
jgi:hypothetical protein